MHLGRWCDSLPVGRVAIGPGAGSPGLFLGASQFVWLVHPRALPALHHSFVRSPTSFTPDHPTCPPTLSFANWDREVHKGWPAVVQAFPCTTNVMTLSETRTSSSHSPRAGIVQIPYRVYAPVRIWGSGPHPLFSLIGSLTGSQSCTFNEIMYCLIRIPLEQRLTSGLSQPPRLRLNAAALLASVELFEKLHDQHPPRPQNPIQNLTLFQCGYLGPHHR